MEYGVSDGRMEQFVESTAQTVFAELTQKDKEFLVDHPDPYEHHFGLGLHIRNRFINGKDLGFVWMADDLSTRVVGRLIRMAGAEPGVGLSPDSEEE